MIFLGTLEPQSSDSGAKNKSVIDEAIFVKIAENDMPAFEEFYRLTERSVYAFALSILKNHEDALDVMQDTYLKVRGAAHLYEPMGKPMAWIFSIARNLAISKLRANKHIEDVPVEDIENDMSFSYVVDNEDKVVLEIALNILNDQERSIILLHAVSGLTHHQIAKDLGIPLSTELSKYQRGLRKLKKYLVGKEALK